MLLCDITNLKFLKLTIHLLCHQKTFFCNIKGCVRYIFASLFLSLNKSTCQTRENVFYFTWKALFFLEKSNFEILHFRILLLHQMPKHKIKKYILLNNLGSKHSLLMKFGKFVSYYKRKNFIKKFYKKCGLKTSFRLFCVCKELSTTSIGQWNFWTYFY